MAAITRELVYFKCEGFAHWARCRSVAQTIEPGTIIGRRADDLTVDEEKHFSVCKACGRAVDMRDLGQVFHHEVPGHDRAGKLILPPPQTGHSRPAS